MKMEMVWKVIKVLLRFCITTLLTFWEIEAKSKNPICGSMEAYRRREEGTITLDEFIEATK